MVAEGSVFKRCGCVGSDGKQLGQQCPQLRRRDGSWYSGHGTWNYQLELPRTRAGARRTLRRRLTGVDETRKAAVAELDRARALLALAGDDHGVADEIATLLQELRRGEQLPNPHQLARLVTAGTLEGMHLTVGEYLSTWVAERTIDENTQRGYASHIRIHLIPHLGDIRLDRLLGRDIERMFKAILHRNEALMAARDSDDPQIRRSVRGQRLTGLSTQYRIRATLHKALNDAIGKRRLIDLNPVGAVDLPTSRKPRARVWTQAAITYWRFTGKQPSPVMVWAPAHAAAFLAYAHEHDPDLYPLFRIILLRGPRRGEAVGLRTDQIDIDTAMIVFTHQLTCHEYAPIYKPVKTRDGDRIVAIDARTVADLSAYAERRARFARKLGDAWPAEVRLRSHTPGLGRHYSDVDLFFRQPDGQPWHPNKITERFHVLVDQAGLPPCRLHDGRHAAASYAKAAGGDLIDLKEQLGLANISTAGDIYAVTLEEIQRQLAEATATLVCGPAPQTLPRQRRAPAEPAFTVPARES